MLRRIALSTAPLVAIALLLWSAGRAEAAGLINSLPKDGSSVTLKISAEFERDGEARSFERTMKLSSVGTGQVGGEAARWIEISTRFRDQQIIAKLLIPEKYLKGDDDPFEHVDRGYIRRGDEQQEYDSDNARGLRILRSVPHLSNVKKGEKETIKVPLGEFECQQQSGTAEATFGDNTVTYEATLWTSEKVPFGLARATVNATFDSGSFKSTIEAVEASENAESELAGLN